MASDDGLFTAFSRASHGAGHEGWSRSGESIDDEPGFRTLFAPVAPFNRWPLLSPIIGMAGAVAVFALTGVAAAALVVMSLSLLVVVYLLSEVFGYEIVLPNMTR